MKSYKNYRFNNESPFKNTLQDLSEKCRLSKSYKNLSSLWPDNKPSHFDNKNEINDFKFFNKLDSPKKEFYKSSFNLNQNEDLSIKNLISKMFQMEEKIENQSAKINSFEKKVVELNDENEELKKNLFFNKKNKFDESNYLKLMNSNEQIQELNDRLKNQVVLNKHLEIENNELNIKLQEIENQKIELESQSIELKENYENLIKFKDCQINELKIENKNLINELNNKINFKEQKNFCDKIDFLDQIIDQQTENLNEKNFQLKNLEKIVIDLKNKVKLKEIETNSLKKELILNKNLFDKIEKNNRTNENLIIWLNKQLIESQNKYSIMFPKPKNFLNQSKEFECTSEPLYDSKLMNKFCQNNNKNNGTNVTNRRARLIENFDENSIYDRSEVKSNYLKKNLLYTNKKVSGVDPFQCTIGK